MTIYAESTILSAQSEETSSKPLCVALVGDLKNGRTVHSLLHLLALVGGFSVVYISPSGLEIPLEVHYVAAASGMLQHNTVESLKDALAIADVIYVTRVQREYVHSHYFVDAVVPFLARSSSETLTNFFETFFIILPVLLLSVQSHHARRFSSLEEYEAVKGTYCLDTAAMKSAKPHAVVLHPLPRVDEISPDVDKDPRAAYFRQVKNGMYMRMAILRELLGV